jgi:hypothetical protein
MLTVPLSVFAAVTLLSVVIGIRLQEGLIGFAILHVPMLLIISRVSGLGLLDEFNLTWVVLIDAFVGPAMLLGLGAGYLVAGRQRASPPAGSATCAGTAACSPTNPRPGTRSWPR